MVSKCIASIVPSEGEERRGGRGEKSRKWNSPLAKGKRRGGGEVLSPSPPRPRARHSPLLQSSSPFSFFLYSSSRLATPYFSGKLFISFLLVLSSSLYVRSSVRPSVRPLAASCASPPKSHGLKESGSIESEQKRGLGSGKWEEGCSLGTKNARTLFHIPLPEWTSLKGERGERDGAS